MDRYYCRGASAAGRTAMPQTWKITRSRLSIFQPEHRWRKSAQNIISLSWAVFWAAAAIWLLTGGTEARQVLAGIIRNLTQIFRDAFSGFAWLFK